MNTQNENTTVETVAAELSAAFTSDKRQDGKKFYKVRDGAPAWINSDLTRSCHEAIDDRMPNDWVYEQIATAADSLSSYDSISDMQEAASEIADGQVDVYNTDRAQWLADHLGNADLCNEAVAEGLADGKDIHQTIGCAQYMAIERIIQAMINAIKEEANKRDSAAEDEES